MDYFPMLKKITDVNIKSLFEQFINNLEENDARISQLESHEKDLKDLQRRVLQLERYAHRYMVYLQKI